MVPDAPRTTTTRRLSFLPLAGALLGAFLGMMLAVTVRALQIG